MPSEDNPDLQLCAPSMNRRQFMATGALVTTGATVLLTLSHNALGNTAVRFAYVGS
jgi:hypothetical protein